MDPKDSVHRLLDHDLLQLPVLLQLPQPVLRVKAGERQLFHELVRPYERAVFITTYGILRDHADAEDAAQETMLKALVHLDQLADPEKLKGWLLQIAVNEARLKRRGNHGNLFEAIDGNADPGAEEPFMPLDFADWRELPSDIGERKEIRVHITRALYALPDIYTAVLSFSLTEVTTFRPG